MNWARARHTGGENPFPFWFPPLQKQSPWLLELVLGRHIPLRGLGGRPPRRGLGLWIQQQPVGRAHPDLEPCVHTLPGELQRSKKLCGNLGYFCQEFLQHFEDTRSIGVTFIVGKKNRELQERQLRTSLVLILFPIF